MLAVRATFVTLTFMVGDSRVQPSARGQDRFLMIKVLGGVLYSLQVERQNVAGGQKVTPPATPDALSA